MIEICVSQAAPHQEDAARALLAGLWRHGEDADISYQAHGQRGDILVCWGWRKGQSLRQAFPGRRVLVIEHGFVGDRWHWLSLGWDGLNGNARFPLIDDGGGRWRQHFPNALRPVQAGGRYHLLLGQVRGDMSLESAGNFERWYRDAYCIISANHGFPVHFRPHPLDIKRYGAERACMGLPHVQAGSLQDALQGAASAWAFNSNSLVDAALAGVPVYAFSKGAMVWPISGLDWLPALDPDQRERWAHRLAWCQWTHDEMRSGAAWEAVQTAMAVDAPTWSEQEGRTHAAA